MIVHRYIGKPAGRLATDRHKQAWIGFREYANVSSRWRSKPVLKNADRPVALVEAHVIEGRGVVRPNR